MSKIKLLAMFPVLALASAHAQSASSDKPKDYRVQLETVRAKYNLPSLTGISIVGNRVQGVGVTGQLAGTYVGGKAATLNAKYQLGSISKGMTATMIARLVEQGKLSWDSKLGDVLKDVPMRDEYRSVTLLELLSHRAGIVASVPKDTLPPTPNLTREQARVDQLRVFLSQPKGPKAFLYSNTGYVAASMMAEQVTGKSWRQLMQDEVFTPLGMDGCDFGPGTDGIDPAPHRFISAKEIKDYPMATGNSVVFEGADHIRCTMNAMVPYMQAHLYGEKGSTYLKPATWKFLHTDPFGEKEALGWQISNPDWAKGNTYFHTGTDVFNYAYLYLVPGRNVGVLVATNIGGDSKGDVSQTRKAMIEIRDTLLTDALKAKP